MTGGNDSHADATETGRGQQAGSGRSRHSMVREIDQQATPVPDAEHDPDTHVDCGESVRLSDRAGAAGNPAADNSAFGRPSRASDDGGPADASFRRGDRRGTFLTIALTALALVLAAILWWPDSPPPEPLRPEPPAAPQPRNNPDTRQQAQKAADNRLQPQKPPATRLRLENARGYLAAGEFQAALDEINAIHPDGLTADHYSLRARGFVGTGDTQTALAQTSRAIEHEPGTAVYYSERSEMLLSRGTTEDFNAAVDDLTKAIRFDGAQPRYCVRRATVRMQLEEYESAVADYGKAIELADQETRDAELASWHILRASARGLHSDDPESLKLAVVDADAAINADPDEPRNYRNRARLHGRLGNRQAELTDHDASDRLKRGL